MMCICQDDLDPDDIFILDTFAEVYVWVGHGASEDEKRLSADAAHKYVRQVTEYSARAHAGCRNHA